MLQQAARLALTETYRTNTANVCRQQQQALATVKELAQTRVIWAVMCTDQETLQCNLLLEDLR